MLACNSMSQACFVNNNVCLRWFLELYPLSTLKVLTLLFWSKTALYLEHPATLPKAAWKREMDS